MCCKEEEISYCSHHTMCDDDNEALSLRGLHYSVSKLHPHTLLSSLRRLFVRRSPPAVLYISYAYIVPFPSHPVRPKPVGSPITLSPCEKILKLRCVGSVLYFVFVVL